MTLAVFLLPVLVGLVGTLLPAFGVLPAIGAVTPSLDPWRTLFNWPGFSTALTLTLTVGALSSALSLLLSLALVIALQGSAWFQRAQAALTPLLAAPHAAVALGLAFVIAPSGWIVRLISPELTGWTRPPPDLVTLRDPYGLALVLGLLVKEVPYLTLMLAAALGQLPARRLVETSRVMGYAPATAWVKAVLPSIWPQLRLPVYAVIAYSFSVVDQALVLGPGTPPPLAVLATRWFTDFDIALHLPAAAAATLQLVIVAGAILVCRLIEAVLARLGRAWVERGARRGVVDVLVPPLAILAALVLALGLAGLVSLGVWSVAEAWPFPADLPSAVSLATWAQTADRIAGPLGATLVIALAATAVALALCLACLENEDRCGTRGAGALWLLYVPLLVPQIAFLFGVQVALVRLSLDGTLIAVVWCHVVFTLPYVFLSLADPWRALDKRYARGAASLGASPLRVFLAVKLPILTRPILVASAVGMTVSVAQYLPTLFAGAGRVATITTEALTLSAGADRRVVSAWGFTQAALPLIAYATAVLLPRLLHRDRRGLQ